MFSKEKSSGKSRSLESNQTKIKKNNIADSVLLSQYRLKQYIILNTKCIRVIDPERPEKNITTLRRSRKTKSINIRW